MSAQQTESGRTAQQPAGPVNLAEIREEEVRGETDVHLLERLHPHTPMERAFWPYAERHPWPLGLMLGAALVIGWFVFSWLLDALIF